MFSGGRFWREDLGETAFHFVHAGNSGFAEAKEFPVPTVDDWQKFWFLPTVRLTHEDNTWLRGQNGLCNTAVESGLTFLTFFDFSKKTSQPLL